jgi:L-alanine-DL-glutamate epimerase-like enolase superfamily enzyme
MRVEMVAGLMVSARIERWPIDGAFTIARGAKTEAVVVVAEVTDGQVTGRGECTPYARYGETPEGVLAQIQGAAGRSRDELAATLPPGAARNALDCALWDFKAKSSDRSAAALAGLEPLRPVLTAYTLSLDTPEKMAVKAAWAASYPLLKLKLGSDGDDERLYAIREARPDARLIVDVNEGWRAENLADRLDICAAVGVEVVEQPLPAEQDGVLAGLPRPVPLCADESAHSLADVGGLNVRYDAVNIKLDKTGGLTEALAMAQAARAAGLKIMVGCMVSTSLAMAPAMLLAQGADWVDLDGPLLLARDRAPGLSYAGPFIRPPSSALWG